VEYNDSKKLENDLIFNVEAKIYKSSKEQDSSYTRNMIYNENSKTKDSHIAYVSGYPDGRVKPDGMITRAEIATMIARMFGINVDINTLIVFVNVFTFLLYGYDKVKAKRKGFRVPEGVLLTLALFFGGAGALFGMVVYNHKTSKLSFRIIVPLCCALNYILGYDSFSMFKNLLTYLLQLIPE
jgi:uncharacterized membrane protein YsdA (DUF1294 family)